MKWGRAETNRRKRLAPRFTRGSSPLTTSSAAAVASPQPALLYTGTPPARDGRPMSLAG